MKNNISRILQLFKKNIYLSVIIFFIFFNSQSLAATNTFDFTGSNQSFTVPAGVTSITMEGFGAAGGDNEAGDASGGNGGYLKSTITVTPGDVLTIVVGKGGGINDEPFGDGGQGGSGSPLGNFAAGSGGGATYVKNSSNETLFVIGAGGGAGGAGLMDQGADGGAGGGLIGGDGFVAFGGGPPGEGGTQGFGGAGPGSPGASLAGGDGADFNAMMDEGGGGGGGAGYFGGGGGDSGFMMDPGSGGGGGSSFVIAGSTDTTNTQGHASATGDGSITFTYTLPESESEGESEEESESESELPSPTTDKKVISLANSQVKNIMDVNARFINMLFVSEFLFSSSDKTLQRGHNIKLDFGNAILTSLSNELLAKNEKSLLPDNWSSWSAGSINMSKIGDSATSSSSEIDSHSFVLGFETKLNNNDTLGFAIQYGQSDTDVGSNGTNLDGEDYSLAVYRARPLADNHFIAGTIGVGVIESDLKRVSGSNTLTGSRDGTQVFGSVKYGKKINKGDFSLTPIGRVDLGYTELDSYTETGTNALSYDKQTIESGLASLGVEINNVIKFSNSSLKPFGSLEYGLDFSNSSDAKMNYVSDSSTKYNHTVGINSNHLITSAIGFEYLTKDNLNILTSYKRTQGNESEHTDSINVSLNFKSKEETNYAMTLDGSEDLKAGFDITKNVNGFDLSFNADQSLSERDQQAKVSLSRKF
jgi:hypothetical protein